MRLVGWLTLVGVAGTPARAADAPTPRAWNIPSVPEPPEVPARWYLEGCPWAWNDPTPTTLKDGRYCVGEACTPDHALTDSLLAACHLPEDSWTLLRQAREGLSNQPAYEARMDRARAVYRDANARAHEEARTEVAACAKAAETMDFVGAAELNDGMKRCEAAHAHPYWKLPGIDASEREASARTLAAMRVRQQWRRVDERFAARNELAKDDWAELLRTTSLAGDAETKHGSCERLKHEMDVVGTFFDASIEQIISDTARMQSMLARGVSAGERLVDWTIVCGAGLLEPAKQLTARLTKVEERVEAYKAEWARKNPPKSILQIAAEARDRIAQLDGAAPGDFDRYVRTLEAKEDDAGACRKFFVGETVWVDDESKLDAVTALSGSGPAYVFRFIESMIDGGVALGLDADQARRLAIQTVLGAAQLAASASEPPSVLRERVTSKGGTTAAALTVMAERDLPALVADAMAAACSRSEALGREFGAGD